MTVKHTLTDELMLGYAAGTLPEAFDLVIASHLSLNDEARAGVESYEALGGAVLECGDAVEMGDSALTDCMCRLDETPVIAKASVKADDTSVFPAPLRDFVGGDLDSVRWRPIGGGVKQAILKTKGEASVRLLSIPGGVALPDHGHHGTEMTLVLKGAFADDDARFGRGDIEVATEEVDHQPVAEAGETCICLAATDAPLKFNSILPRVLQPFFRI